MLPKKDREIIIKIGRYKFNKMINLGLSYEQFQDYEKKKEKEKKLKKRIGYKQFKEMKELDMNYEEFKQYNREKKFKKYEKKREKDKIRQLTYRFIERYCNLEMKCQVCGTDKNIQIHHPNYKDYLKVNILCIKHHNQLHIFELIPPKIIDLEKIAVKKQCIKENDKYFEENILNMKKDIYEKEFTCTDLEKKYNLDDDTIRSRLKKENECEELIEKLKQNAKKKNLIKRHTNVNNPLTKYKLENNLTTKEISEKTGVPVPTLRAIESGKTKLNNLRPITKEKLKDILKEVK